MMHVTTGILLVHLALYRLIDRRESGAPGTGGGRRPALGGRRFRLVFASPYLRLLAALIVLLNVVNTTGNYIWDKSLTAAADAAVASHPRSARTPSSGATPRT